MLREIELRFNGLDYIKQCLSAGHKVVKQLLHLPLNSGRVWMYASPNLDPSEIQSFKWGGVIRKYQTISEVDFHLEQFIFSYLSVTSPERKYLITQDINTYPTDPGLGSYEGRFFTYGSEVYHFLVWDGENTHRDLIMEVLNRGGTANSMLNVSLLTLLPTELDLPLGHSVESSMINALVQNTQHIIVEAFDGEGYIIWSRN
jgi:hypothetical protein